LSRTANTTAAEIKKTAAKYVNLMAILISES
jgi:hypothetical protein